MPSPDHEYPRLRPVEALSGVFSDGSIALRDPSGLAVGVLAVPRILLRLLALMDGSRRRVEIQAAFARATGEVVPTADLELLLEQLDDAGFLDGTGFERRYAALLAEYRQAEHRPLRTRDGLGAPDVELAGYLEALMGDRDGGFHEGLAGLIAPHLDYARGAPCYAAAYALLRECRQNLRVVILGTNHFGRSRAVVGTTRPFETPFGVAPTDTDFLDRLETTCGGDLFPYELDHVREHSVELHAVWLHHLLGDRVRIVPFLCSDPCGPTATAPYDGKGVDLRHFANCLGRVIREDAAPTLVIASADLSHVGGYFGDRRAVSAAYLKAVGDTDEAALSHIDANAAESFLAHMMETGNPTRICSVGCIYAMMTALGRDARAVRLGYHQAVTREIDNAVTCAAYAFYSS